MNTRAISAQRQVGRSPSKECILNTDQKYMTSRLITDIQMKFQPASIEHPTHAIDMYRQRKSVNPSHNWNSGEKDARSGFINAGLAWHVYIT